MKMKLISILVLLSLLLSSCNYALTTPPASAADNTSLPPTATPTPTPEARVAIAAVAMRNGDYDTALAQYQAATTASDPQVAAEAMLGVGRVYLLQGKYYEAAHQLGWLIDTGASGEFRNMAFFYQAQSYTALESYGQAAEAYGNYLASTQTPLQGDILEMQGDALISASDNTSALAVFQQALASARPEHKEGIQMKIAQTMTSLGDTESALAEYQALYDQTANGDTKSAINLYMGRIYLANGNTADAYTRFQLSVSDFVTSYDTYTQLVALVDAGQQVDELKRGIIDYYAGQYGVAVSALDRYMAITPNHDDVPHYYKALSLYNIGDYEGEVAEWDTLIRDHPYGNNFAKAFIEKATTQKNHLVQYNNSAQTLLQFVTVSPDAPQAADYLYQAARTYEENGQLEDAARTWERVINEYPGSEDAILAQFLSGICYYRLGRYLEAQVIFQKNALLTSAGSDRARAELWIGKSLDMQNKHDEAVAAYEQAVSADPTGYYSIRAQQILDGLAPFPAGSTPNLTINWDKEEADADDWMRERFNIAADVDLNPSIEISQNILYQRGDAFWQLGMKNEAFSEFEALRQELTSDPLNSYRLMKHMVDLGLNYTAVYSARQVLDLTGMDQASFLDSAPAYFNHIRFGVYYSDLIIPTAEEYGFDPLLLFSVIRLESVFESEISSSWGAIGLAQVTPTTGSEIFGELNWPEGFTTKDLFRPVVNVKYGAYYLSKWNTYFENDRSKTLAAYNGGIGNTIIWEELSGDDPDLFLEVIRASETRDYIRYIAEYYEIYKKIYTN
jgi:soluble lytic murein transglycosylase